MKLTTTFVATIGALNAKVATISRMSHPRTAVVAGFFGSVARLALNIAFVYSASEGNGDKPVWRFSHSAIDIVGKSN
jgi:hypothetical protein